MSRAFNESLSKVKAASSTVKKEDKPLFTFPGKLLNSPVVPLNMHCRKVIVLPQCLDDVLVFQIFNTCSRTL